MCEPRGEICASFAVLPQELVIHDTHRVRERSVIVGVISVVSVILPLELLIPFL